MTQMHTISDSCTRIRNSQKVKKSNVVLCYSKLLLGVLGVLKNEGYILGFQEFYLVPGVKKTKVFLKYSAKYNVSSITDISVISTPGRRFYAGYAEIQRWYCGLGIVILSTPLGVLSDTQASTHRVGGELICKVF